MIADRIQLGMLPSCDRNYHDHRLELRLTCDTSHVAVDDLQTYHRSEASVRDVHIACKMEADDELLLWLSCEFCHSVMAVDMAFDVVDEQACKHLCDVAPYDTKPVFHKTSEVLEVAVWSLEALCSMDSLQLPVPSARS